MKKLRFIALFMISLTMLIAGCGDPYSDMKLSIKASGKEIALDQKINLNMITNEDNSVSGEIIEFTADISGTGKNVSSDIYFSASFLNNHDKYYENEYVQIFDISKDKTTTKFKMQAKKVGSTTITIKSLEGGLSQKLDINIDYKVNRITFNQSKFKGVVEGQYIDLSRNIKEYITFNPIQTDQTDIEFYIDYIKGFENFAKIEDNKLYAIKDAIYPTNAEGQKYIPLVASSVNNRLCEDIIQVPVVSIDMKELITMNAYDGTSEDFELEQVSENSFTGVKTYQIDLALQESSQEDSYINTRTLNLQFQDLTRNNSWFSLDYSQLPQSSLSNPDSTANVDCTISSDKNGKYPTENRTDYSFKIQARNVGSQTVSLFVGYYGNLIDNPELKNKPNESKDKYRDVFRFEIKFIFNVYNAPNASNITINDSKDFSDTFEIYNYYTNSIGAAFVVGEGANKPVPNTYFTMSYDRTSYEDGVGIVVSDKGVKSQLSEDMKFTSFEKLQLLHNCSTSIEGVTELTITYHFSLNPHNDDNANYTTYTQSVKVNLQLLVGLEKIELKDIYYLDLVSKESVTINIQDLNATQFVENIKISDSSLFDTQVTDKGIKLTPNQDYKMGSSTLQIFTKNGVISNKTIIQTVIPTIHDNNQHPLKFNIDTTNNGLLGIGKFAMQTSAGASGDDQTASDDTATELTLKWENDYTKYKLENGDTNQTYQSISSVALAYDTTINFNAYFAFMENDKIKYDILANDNVKLTNGEYGSYLWNNGQLIIGNQITTDLNKPFVLEFEVITYTYDAELNISKNVYIQSLNVYILRQVHNIALNDNEANIDIYERSSVGYFDECLEELELKEQLYQMLGVQFEPKIKVNILDQYNDLDEFGSIIAWISINNYDKVLFKSANYEYKVRDLLTIEKMTITDQSDDDSDQNADENTDTDKNISYYLSVNFDDALINDIVQELGGNFSVDDVKRTIINKCTDISLKCEVSQMLGSDYSNTIIKNINITINSANKSNELRLSNVDKKLGLYFEKKFDNSDTFITPKTQSFNYTMYPTEQKLFNEFVVVEVLEKTNDESEATYQNGSVYYKNVSPTSAILNQIHLLNYYKQYDKYFIYQSGKIDLNIESEIQTGRDYAILVSTMDSFGEFDKYSDNTTEFVPIVIADGSVYCPFEIRSEADFNNMRMNLAGTSRLKHYVLTTDLYLKSYKYQPVVYSTSNFVGFYGGFNGQYTYSDNTTKQFTIYHFNLEYTATSVNQNIELSMFGNVSGATIKNVVIAGDSKITLNNTVDNSADCDVNIGFISGQYDPNADVTNVSVSGQIEVNTTKSDISQPLAQNYELNVGGMFGCMVKILGKNKISTFENTDYFDIASSVNIRVNTSQGSVNAGGVVGKIDSSIALDNSDNKSTIKNVKVLADIQVLDNSDENTKTVYEGYSGENSNSYPSIGGIVGLNVDSIVLTNITVNPILIGYCNVGGIVGSTSNGRGTRLDYCNVIFTHNSNFKFKIVGYSNIGGLIGNAQSQTIFNYSYIRNFATLDLNKIDQNYDMFDNTDYYGNIVLLNDDDANRKNVVGGLIGNLNANAKINNSYFDGDINTQNITKDQDYVGGLIGYQNIVNIAIVNTYVVGRINTNLGVMPIYGNCEMTEDSSSGSTAITDRSFSGMTDKYNRYNFKYKLNSNNEITKFNMNLSDCTQLENMYVYLNDTYMSIINNPTLSSVQLYANQLSSSTNYDIKLVSLLNDNEYLLYVDKTEVSSSMSVSKKQSILDLYDYSTSTNIDEINRILDYYDVEYDNNNANIMVINSDLSDPNDTIKVLIENYDFYVNLQQALDNGQTTVNQDGTDVSIEETLKEVLADIMTNIDTILTAQSFVPNNNVTDNDDDDSYDYSITDNRIFKFSDLYSKIDGADYDTNMDLFKTKFNDSYIFLDGSEDNYNLNLNKEFLINKDLNANNPMIVYVYQDRDGYVALYDTIANIVSNVQDEREDQSPTYYKINEQQAIVTYNYIEGEDSNKDDNTYAISINGTVISRGIANVININIEGLNGLDQVEGGIVGINILADYTIKTSNSQVVDIDNVNKTITILNEGIADITVTSVIDDSITSTVKLISVLGFDEVVLKSINDNDQTDESQTETGVDETIYIDQTHSYSLYLENNNFKANKDVGYIIQAEEILGSSESTANRGEISLNGKTIKLDDQIMTFERLNTFNVIGKTLGSLQLKITPIIFLPKDGVYVTNENIIEVEGRFAYKASSVSEHVIFNVNDKAKDIKFGQSGNDTQASMSPYNSINSSVTVVTTNKDEDIKFAVSKNDSNLQNFTMTASTDFIDNSNTSNLIYFKVGSKESTSTTDSNGITLYEITYNFKILFNQDNFNKLYAGGKNPLEQTQIYKITATCDSNTQLSEQFEITLAPNEINKISSYFQPIELSLVNGQHGFKDTMIDAAIPGQNGLLSFVPNAKFNNVSYYTITVSEQFKKLINFTQLQPLLGTNNDYSTFTETPNKAVQVANGIKLYNICYSYDRNSHHFDYDYDDYNFTNYVMISLMENAPQGQIIPFTITAYDLNNNQIMASQVDIQTELLPEIKVTIDDKTDFEAELGSTYKLNIEYANLDSNISISNTNIVLFNTNGTEIDTNNNHIQIKRRLKNNTIIDFEIVSGIIISDLQKYDYYLCVDNTSPVGQMSIDFSGYRQINDYKQVTNDNLLNLKIVYLKIDNINIKNTVYQGKDIFHIAKSELKYIESNINFENVFSTDSAIKGVQTAINNNLLKMLNSYIALGTISNSNGTIVMKDSDSTINSNLWYKKYDDTGSEWNRIVFLKSETAFVIGNNTTGDVCLSIRALEIGEYDMRLEIGYMYDEYGFVQFVDKNAPYKIIYNFTIVVSDNSTQDTPTPIDTAGEFNKLQYFTAGNYILMADIELDGYIPFDLNIESLDGNGFVVRVKSFNLSNIEKNSKNVTFGLFNNISQNTVLKNFIFDVSTYSNVDFGEDGLNIEGLTFGLLAGVNNGNIINSKVVNLDSLRADKKIKIITKFNNAVCTIGGFVGINNGNIANSMIGLTSNGVIDYTQQANNGPFTDTDIEKGIKPNTNNTKATYPFNITTGNVVAGFVSTNTGSITNSYAKAVGIQNTTVIVDKSQTSAFINYNSGKIYSCFVESRAYNGFKAETINSDYIQSSGNISGFVYQNSGEISNAYSAVLLVQNSARTSGFVFENTGSIMSCYSTTRHANGKLTDAHSSFSYMQNGKLEQCYYAIIDDERGFGSNIDPTSPEVKKLDEATAIACTTEKSDGINPFMDKERFDGFYFGDKNDDSGIWYTNVIDISGDNFTSSLMGPRLIGAENIQFSSRQIVDITKNESADDQGDNSTPLTYSYADHINYKQGSKVNPLVINNGQEFVQTIIQKSVALGSGNDVIYVFGGYGDQASYINLASDIVLDEAILDSEYYPISSSGINSKTISLSQVIFNGVLIGNGMNINGIVLNPKNQGTNVVIEDYGLFKQVGVSESQRIKYFGTPSTTSTETDEQNYFATYNLKQASINNVTFNFAQLNNASSCKVGVIAGSIYNANLSKVKVNGSSSSSPSIVTGKNLVGGFAGLISGAYTKINDIDVSNIQVNVTTNTFKNFTNDFTDNSSYYREFTSGSNSNVAISTRLQLSEDNKITNLDVISYGGGITGVMLLNNFEPLADDSLATDTHLKYNNYVKDNTEINVKDIGVNDSIIIKADQVGGVIGYLGGNSIIKDVHFEIRPINNGDDEVYQNLYGYYVAGGIVGEVVDSHIEMAYIEQTEMFQNEVDSNLNNVSSSQISYDKLFTNVSADSSFNVAIGGIAGYASNSTILDSYSKINVQNSQSRIAGGIIGYTENEIYLSNIFTTGNVSARNVMGGIIGFNTYSYKFNVTLSKVYALNCWSSDIYDIFKKNYDIVIVNDTVSASDETRIRDLYTTYQMPEVGNQIPVVQSLDHIEMAKVNSISYMDEYKYVGSMFGQIVLNSYAAISVESGDSYINDVKNILNGEINGLNLSYAFVDIYPYDQNNKYDGYCDFVFISHFNIRQNRNNRVIDYNNIDYTNYFYNNYSTTYSQTKITGSVNNQNIKFNYTNDSLFEYVGYNPTPTHSDNETNTFTLMSQQLHKDKIMGTYWYVIDDVVRVIQNKFLKIPENDNDYNFIYNEYSNNKPTLSTVWYMQLDDILPAYTFGKKSSDNNFTTNIGADGHLSLHDIFSQPSYNRLFYIPNQYNGQDVEIDGYKNEDQTIKDSLYTNTFAGVLTYQKEGNTEYAVFDLNGDLVTTKNMFNTISSANMTNINIQLNVDFTTIENVQSFGYFANQVLNSTFTNCNFKIVFTGKNITDADINKLDNLGLFFGYVQDTTFDNCTFEVVVKDNAALTVELNNVYNFGSIAGYCENTLFNIVKFNSTNVVTMDITANITDNTNNNLGMLVGSASQSQFIDITAGNSNVNNIKFNITNTNNETANTINYGSLIAYMVAGKIININMTNINIESTYSDTKSNVYNLGSIVSYAQSLTIENIKYKNDDNNEISFNCENATINQGIIGYGEFLTINKVHNFNSSINTKIGCKNANIGSIIGYLNGNISNSTSKCNIEITYLSNDNNRQVGVGGIAGCAGVSTFGNIAYYGDISIDKGVTVTEIGNVYAGGITGYQYVKNASDKNITYTNVYAYGDIYYNIVNSGIKADIYISGFVGFVNDQNIIESISDSYCYLRPILTDGYNYDDVNLNPYVNNTTKFDIYDSYYIKDFFPVINSSTEEIYTYIKRMQNTISIYDYLKDSEYKFNSAASLKFGNYLPVTNSNYTIISGALDYADVFTEEIKELDLDSLLINDEYLSIFDSLDKYNPNIITENEYSEMIANTIDDYNIIESDSIVIDNITNGNAMTIAKTGLVTGTIIDGEYSKITMESSAHVVINENKGIISNLAMYVETINNTSSAHFMTTNNGSIENVVFYGSSPVSSINVTHGSFVYQNKGIISRAGISLIYNETINTTNNDAAQISAFVYENTNYIGDCFVTSIVSNDVKVEDNIKLAGMVYTNTGIVTKVLFGGDIGTLSENNIVYGKNSMQSVTDSNSLKIKTILHNQDSGENSIYATLADYFDKNSELFCNGWVSKDISYNTRINNGYAYCHEGNMIKTGMTCDDTGVITELFTHADGGQGTYYYYPINNEKDFISLTKSKDAQIEDAYIRIINNLDFNGNYSDDSYKFVTEFTNFKLMDSIFDGNNKTLSAFRVNSHTNSDAGGLIESAKNVIFKNVKLSNGVISSDKYNTGALVGRVLESCTFDGAFTFDNMIVSSSRNHIGGIFGSIEAVTQNMFTDANFTLSNSYIGIKTQTTTSDFKNNKNTGIQSDVGGFVGNYEARITIQDVTFTLNGSKIYGKRYVAGFIPSMSSDIQNLTLNINQIQTDDQKTIDNIISGQQSVAGVCGKLYSSTIENSTLNVNSDIIGSIYVGGVIGNARASETNSEILNNVTIKLNGGIKDQSDLDNMQYVGGYVGAIDLGGYDDKCFSENLFKNLTINTGDFTIDASGYKDNIYQNEFNNYISNDSTIYTAFDMLIKDSFYEYINGTLTKTSIDNVKKQGYGLTNDKSFGQVFDKYSFDADGYVEKGLQFIKAQDKTFYWQPKNVNNNLYTRDPNLAILTTKYLMGIFSGEKEIYNYNTYNNYYDTITNISDFKTSRANMSDDNLDNDRWKHSGANQFTFNDFYAKNGFYGAIGTGTPDINNDTMKKSYMTTYDLGQNLTVGSIIGDIYHLGITNKISVMSGYDLDYKNEYLGQIVKITTAFYKNFNAKISINGLKDVGMVLALNNSSGGGYGYHLSLSMAQFTYHYQDGLGINSDKSMAYGFMFKDVSYRDVYFTDSSCKNFYFGLFTDVQTIYNKDMYTDNINKDANVSKYDKKIDIKITDYRLDAVELEDIRYHMS